MPKPEEIQAVLDVLFMSRNLNHEFEQRMFAESARKDDYKFIDRVKLRKPTRYYAGYTKHDFDKKFRDIVELALEQAEAVRRGKTAADVQLPFASVVMIQSDHYGVELYLGRAGVHFVDGFTSPHAADHWAKYSSSAFLKERGLPEGTKLEIVGEKYY